MEQVKLRVKVRVFTISREKNDSGIVMTNDRYRAWVKDNSLSKKGFCRCMVQDNQLNYFYNYRENDI